MELTLESALSAQGSLGHLAYLLLVVSMLMRNMTWLRLLVIASSLVGISYTIFILNDPVSTFWESVLVLVNISQLLLLHWKNIRASFNDEEMEFYRNKLPGLAAGVAREFLNRGSWIDADDGTELTCENVCAGCLIYISRGDVDILSRGVKVSQCGPGDFVGELTAFNNEAASATTLVRKKSRLWRIASEDLLAVTNKYPEIQKELDAAFSRNYREKFVRSNLFIASSMEGFVPAT